MSSETAREAAIGAFLDLVATQGFGRVTLAEVARHSGIALSEMRAFAATPYDLLDAFQRRIDRQVLAEGGPDDGIDMTEPPQERLFEVLMRRLDALEPYRAAIAALARDARRDPRLALALLRGSVRAQRWMLAAAGIDSAGLRGDLKARGLALLFARLVEVWLADEDPGLSRTMAHLDEELRRGARMLGMADDLATIARLGKRPRRAGEGRGQEGAGGADRAALNESL